MGTRSSSFSLLPPERLETGREPKYRKGGRGRQPPGPGRRSPWAYAWAFPTTALGLLIGALTLATGGAVQRRDGCLEFHRAFARALLESPRLDASAITLGHVILGRDAAALEANRAHEHVHVRQTERLGPLFLPLYGLAAVWAALRHGRHYEANWFEVEARLKSGQTHAAEGPARSGPTRPGRPPT